jgi:prepilin-type N-terminal cleavage/methylation domain-containing protein
MNIVHKNQGFTILETIVAIAILLISIAGPLTVAEKALTEAASSQDQMTASYLAQDLMEYVKNIRDDNLLANYSSWLASLSQCQTGDTQPCDFDTESGDPSKLASPTASCNLMVGSLCQIYLNSSSNGYSYYTPINNINNGTPSTPTKFSRAFTIDPIGGSTATSSLLTVTVAWKTGNVADKVVIQDIIFNTLR